MNNEQTKTLGQIAYEAHVANDDAREWSRILEKGRDAWERIASAVRDAVLAELPYYVDNYRCAHCGGENSVKVTEQSAEPVVEEKVGLPPLDYAHSGPAWEDYRNELGRVRGRLVATESELTRLRSQFRWIPISERLPTEKDANHEGCVWMWDQDEETFPAHPIQEIHWSNVEPRRHGTILWMSPIPLPEPSPETEEQKKAAWLASLPEEHRSTLGWYKLIDAAWQAAKSTGGQA